MPKSSEQEQSKTRPLGKKLHKTSFPLKHLINQAVVQFRREDDRVYRLHSSSFSLQCWNTVSAQSQKMVMPLFNQVN